MRNDLGQSGGCEVCGQDVRVRVLAGYRDGEPLLQQLCLACADRPRAAEAPRTPSKARLSVGAMLIVAGAVTAVLGALDRVISVPHHAGFGFYQQFGVACGGFLVMIGALLRADLVAVAGTVLFGFSACADLVGLASSVDLDLRGRVIILFGLLLVALGMRMRRTSPATQRV